MSGHFICEYCGHDGSCADDCRTHRPVGQQWRGPLKPEEIKRMKEMTWDNRYRPLREGEIILSGDEYLPDSHLGWQPAKFSIGEKAPDPAYTSHRMYRRLRDEQDIFNMSNAEVDAELKRLGMDPDQVVADIDAATKRAIAKALRRTSALTGKEG